MFGKKLVWERATDKENCRTFKCPRCKGICYTIPILRDGKSYCNYKFCPNCGKRVFIE